MKKLKILFLLQFFLFFGTVKVFAYDFPRINVSGDLSNMQSKDDVRKVTVHYSDGEYEFETYATMKIQGSGSRKYDKKNYTIKFYKSDLYQKKQLVNFGWGGQSKYCLKANWLDKTQARNIATARLVAQMQQKYNLFSDTPNNGAIDGFPISVYENDNFLGLYTLNIPKDAWLFNMDKDNGNHIIFSTLKTYFDKEAIPGDNQFDIELANDEELAYKQLNRLIDFINNSSDEEFKDHFDEYLDLHATINYLIMGYYGNLTDNYRRNMLLVTYDGLKWYPSLYDLEASFGTDIYGQLAYSPDRKIWSKEEGEKNILWERLEKNFKNEIAEQYFELRNDVLTYDNTISLLYDIVDSIPEKVYKKDEEKYKNSISKKIYKGLLGAEISQVEEWLPERIKYLDEYFAEYYTIEPEVSVIYTKDNNKVNATIITNRSDIIILNNDNKKIHTFYKDNSFIFEWKTRTGEYNGKIEAITNDFKRQYNYQIINIIIILLFSGFIVSFSSKYIKHYN